MLHIANIVLIVHVFNVIQKLASLYKMINVNAHNFTL